MTYLLYFISLIHGYDYGYFWLQAWTNIIIYKILVGAKHIVYNEKVVKYYQKRVDTDAMLSINKIEKYLIYKIIYNYNYKTVTLCIAEDK